MLQKIRDLIVIVLVTLFLCELTLRLQQVAGPLYDLEMDDVPPTALIEKINHGPEPNRTRTFGNATVFGDYYGMTYTQHYDSHGIRINALRPSQFHPEAVNILFLGDSFIEGYDDANTVPQKVWEELLHMDKMNADRIRILNAGHGSYSPSIYVAQAKMLLPVLRPDIVVVDIDETDIFDDLIRYRKLIVRDDNGKIIKVNSNIRYRTFIHGLNDIKKEYLYLIRFIRKIYHTRYFTKQFNRKFDYYNILKYSHLDETTVRHKFSEDIAFFEKNIDELINTLINNLGSHERVIMLHHPHLNHIISVDGYRFNNIVAHSIKKIANKNNVLFYDATNDLKKVFGTNPGKYYWKGDMHFNFDGIREYGRLVARKVVVVSQNVSRNQ